MGRKAADLNPDRQDMVAGLPGEYSTLRAGIRLGDQHQSGGTQ